MSGIPDYYLKQRWIGLDNLLKIVGDQELGFYKNSLEPSLGDRYRDLIKVIDNIISSQSMIKTALHENKISKKDLYCEFGILEARIDEAIRALSAGAEEIIKIKNNL